MFRFVSCQQWNKDICNNSFVLFWSVLRSLPVLTFLQIFVPPLNDIGVSCFLLDFLFQEVATLHEAQDLLISQKLEVQNKVTELEKQLAKVVQFTIWVLLKAGFNLLAVCVFEEIKKNPNTYFIERVKEFWLLSKMFSCYAGMFFFIIFIIDIS